MTTPVAQSSSLAKEFGRRKAVAGAGYYQAAYVSAGVLYTGYIASLWWRARRLRK